MNVLIVEDEPAASKNLEIILREIDAGMNILATINSVQELIEWIPNNPDPDLAFFDIQLSDDNVFKAFRKIDIPFPVVFITAYDSYAIRAFKVNSIDYLLKPVRSSEVNQAIEKYRHILRLGEVKMESQMLSMLKDLSGKNPSNYRQTLLAHYRDKLIPVETSDFAFFHIENGIVYGTTHQGKQYPLNQKLEELEKQLDPDSFFRINRQVLISRTAVKEISPHFKDRLLLRLRTQPKWQVIVSRAKSGNFKAWISQ